MEEIFRKVTLSFLLGDWEHAPLLTISSTTAGTCPQPHEELWLLMQIIPYRHPQYIKNVLHVCLTRGVLAEFTAHVFRGI